VRASESKREQGQGREPQNEKADWHRIFAARTLRLGVGSHGLVAQLLLKRHLLRRRREVGLVVLREDALAIRVQQQDRAHRGDLRLRTHAGVRERTAGGKKRKLGPACEGPGRPRACARTASMSAQQKEVEARNGRPRVGTADGSVHAPPRERLLVSGPTASCCRGAPLVSLSRAASSSLSLSLCPLPWTRSACSSSSGCRPRCRRRCKPTGRHSTGRRCHRRPTRILLRHCREASLLQEAQQA
jgi:hypothetical protein